MGSVVQWLMGSRSNDPLIRYGRLALIFFAIAATAVTYSSGRLTRLIFVAVFVVGFAVMLWGVNEILKGKTPGLVFLGRTLAGTMLAAVVALFLLTVSYLVAGWPPQIGRVLEGAGTPVPSTSVQFFLITEQVSGGPISLSQNANGTTTEVVNIATAKLPGSIREKLPAGLRIFSVKSQAFLTVGSPFAPPGTEDTFLISNVDNPDRLLTLFRNYREKRDATVATPALSMAHESTGSAVPLPVAQGDSKPISDAKPVEIGIPIPVSGSVCAANVYFRDSSTPVVRVANTTQKNIFAWVGANGWARQLGSPQGEIRVLMEADNDPSCGNASTGFEGETMHRSECYVEVAPGSTKTVTARQENRNATALKTEVDVSCRTLPPRGQPAVE